MDRKLIEAVIKGKDGDKQSLTEIYNETKDMVYFTVLKLVKNQNDAQDLVQETYIQALQNLKGLKDENAFIKWLKTIAVNLSKNHLKKCNPLLFKTEEQEEKELASIPEISEDFLPAEYADRKEKCRLVMEIVDGLPSMQRTTILLYYFDELSIGEIAKIMETSEGTTKSRLNYARKQIKDKVELKEKEGTKLYGIQTIPILMRILQNASKDYSMPVEVSRNILEELLKADADKASAETAKVKINPGTSKVTGTGLTNLVAKFAAASIPQKIIAGIVAAGLVAGGGISIGRIVKNSNRAVSQYQSNALKTSQNAQLENRKWEELLGKTKEEIIALLGKPNKEDSGEIYYTAGDTKPSSLKIQLDKDNVAIMVSCNSDNYSVQGVKKGDTLEQVKSIFGGITGASLEEEDRDCGDLSAIFYTIDNYSYQFLYNKNKIVNHFAISLIQREEFTDKTTTTENPAASNVETPTQNNESQPQSSETIAKNSVPTGQTQAGVNSTQTAKKIAVEDLIYADKNTITARLGKPITYAPEGDSFDMLYDGIIMNHDISNKELESSTHQQNYTITLSSSEYSLYGFYPGMTKQELLKNAKKYVLLEESGGMYQFDFSNNGATVILYVDFTMGGTVTEVSLQAFVAW